MYFFSEKITFFATRNKEIDCVEQVELQKLRNLAHSTQPECGIRLGDHDLKAETDQTSNIGGFHDIEIATTSSLNCTNVDQKCII